MFIAVPAQTVVGQFLSTFQEFPPSQKVGGISVNKAVELLQQSAGGK
jgi:hypothetical protein